MLRREKERNFGLTAVFFVCLLSFQTKIANCSLNHLGYIELDYYLRTTIESNDFSTNLQEVNSYLQDFIKHPEIQGMFPDLTVALLEIDAAIQPRDLECSPQEIQIFKTLAGRTDSHKYLQSPESELTRLEFIIYQISKIHAHRCFLKYQNKFLQLHSDWLASRPNEFVERFMMQLTSRKPTQSVMSHNQSLLEREDLNLQRYSIYAAFHIKTLATSRERRSIDVIPLVNKYLKDPCREFNDYFGQNLFDMVLFDEQMIHDLSEVYSIAYSELRPFFMARATYLTCKAILISEEFDQNVLSIYLDQTRRANRLSKSKNVDKKE